MKNRLVSALKKIYKNKLNHRYILIGGLVYLLEIFIIVMVQTLGYSAVLAVALSYWSGLVASFLLHKLFTFKDRRVHRKILLPQIAAFVLLVLFNFGFTLLMVKLLRHLMPVVIIRTVALGITTIWNLYIYRTRVFKNRISNDIIY